MIDAHIHLQDPRFAPDRDTLIRRAKKTGVTSFFCAATRPNDWNAVLALFQNNEGIIPFIGTHPWYADEHDPDLLAQYLHRYPAAGVGEIGLDALHGSENQETVFKNQLATAARFSRPCILHCVRCFDMIAPILKQTKELPPALMFHAFNGTKNDVDFLIGKNAYFSFSGTALFPQKTKLHQLIAALPADRILVETDAPDMLPPEKFRTDPTEKRNLPENLGLIIDGIAAIRKTDPAEFSAVIKQNALQFLSGLKQ